MAFQTKFNKRSEKLEWVDTQQFSKEELYKNLREYEMINRWLGTRSLLLRAFKMLYRQHPSTFKEKHLKIADLGSGAGDLLNAIACWAKRKQVTCNLIGIDQNPEMILYARNVNSPAARSLIKTEHMQYKQMDVLSESFKNEKYDIVCLNNFCHHLGNQQLISLLQNLRHQTHIAIIINDLHRHFLAYYTIIFISKIFKLSNLACHDGPLSVLRAFRKKDWVEIMSQIPALRYTISWRWPFRWLVILDCRNDNWRLKCE